MDCKMEYFLLRKGAFLLKSQAFTVSEVELGFKDNS
jgi:hypothetical protein